MKLAVADLNDVPVLCLVDTPTQTLRLVPDSVITRGDEDPVRTALCDRQAWQALQRLESSNAKSRLETVDLDATGLRPPLKPGAIVCLASNYSSHMHEARLSRKSKHPWLFMKPSSSVSGPDATIVMPSADAAVDWEVELCVVIGRTCRRVGPSEALGYVAGFTVGNDVSLRVIDSLRETDGWDEFFSWMHGKWYDTFTPLGPWVVSSDEMLPQLPARLTLTVNGELKQDGLSSGMIFGVAESISFISSITTLGPGDVVMTGTPSGVGAPAGTFLKPGDLVEASIEGIGTLRSHVGSTNSGDWDCDR